MRKLLPDQSDFESYSEIIHKPRINFIRCNTLKISPGELKKRLTKKGWKTKQPYKKHPEIFLIKSDLGPGELGRSIEHLLGYYYVQEVSSMLPVIALEPKENEFIFDMCAAPGSKTTQLAAYMKNKGTIMANELKMDRIRILSSNTERCGASNVLISRKDCIALSSKLSKAGLKFDKILLDAPCSGEGTLRSSPRTFLIWNLKVVKKLAREQKKMLAFALKALKKGGILIYSTCTHAPEENEEVVNFALDNFPVRLEHLNLPLKCRPGLIEWKDKEFHPETIKCCRIYPQDNDSEGFFVAKFTLLEDIKE